MSKNQETNLPLSGQNIIDLYHAHGISKQYHNKIKINMDIERLPSGKFDSNKLVLDLTIISYNILRIVGQEPLKSVMTQNERRSTNTGHAQSSVI